MSNIFSFRHGDPPEKQISISDLGTDVLFDILVLAGSALAQTDSEKRLTVWLAEHCRRVGSGTVGFCIADMPWAPESFDSDREFMVRTVDAASQRTGWEKLGYHPKSENLLPMLGWFRKCFVRLKAEDINPDVLPQWQADMEDDDPVLCGFPCCEEHGILLTWLGCRICAGRTRFR